HQWWGNLLLPGKGPGGNILAEGMANYSSILLMEQVKGLGPRIELAKRMESHYARDRHLDAERPLVKIDDSHEGDTSVTYQKGGWVFFMLTNLMGRQAAFAGLHALIEQFRMGPDHPQLEDFLATMRKYAPDPAAFDAFAKQWFYDVV